MLELQASVYSGLIWYLRQFSNFASGFEIIILLLISVLNECELSAERINSF